MDDDECFDLHDPKIVFCTIDRLFMLREMFIG